MPAAVVARAVLPSTEGTAGPGHRVWPVGRFTPPLGGRESEVRAFSGGSGTATTACAVGAGRECPPSRAGGLPSRAGSLWELARAGSSLRRGDWLAPPARAVYTKRDSHKAKLAAAVARAVLPGDGRGRSTRLVWVHASRGGDLGLEPGGGRPKITNEDPTDHDVQMPTAVVARAVLLGNGQGRSMRLVWIHASRGGGLGSEHTAAQRKT